MKGKKRPIQDKKMMTFYIVVMQSNTNFQICDIHCTLQTPLPVDLYKLQKIVIIFHFNAISKEIYFTIPAIL